MARRRSRLSHARKNERKLRKRGPNRAFDDATVRRIRERLVSEMGAALATEYGVSLRTIYDLKAGRSYRDVV